MTRARLMCMRLFKSATAASLIFGMVIGTATAKEASPKDRAALVSTVERFDTAMRGDDFPTVIGMVPKKVFAEMAKRFELSPGELAQIVAEQMTDVVTQVEILEFEMDTAQLDMAETTGGIAYTFLPTRTLIEMQGTKVETNSFTLALRDGAEWSLVRIDDAAQLKILREVYPGFVGVEFPKGTTKLID